MNDVKHLNVSVVFVLVCFQELECLQDHLDDLVSNCRDIVGNLTELESEVYYRFQGM